MSSPRRVRNSTRQAFIDEVGDEKVGDFLYKFYINYLYFGGSPTLKDKQLKRIRNLGERQIDHLREVIKKYDLVYIIECAGAIVEKLDSGIIATRTVRPGYFDKVLLNKSFQDEKNSGFSYD